MDTKKDTGPVTPGNVHQPLTRVQREQGYVIILVFVIWHPVYLIWVRPILNRWMFQHGVDSYPAELHVIPALALPLLAAFVYTKLILWRRGDSE